MYHFMASSLTLERNALWPVEEEKEVNICLHTLVGHRGRIIQRISTLLFGHLIHLGFICDNFMIVFCRLRVKFLEHKFTSFYPGLLERCEIMSYQSAGDPPLTNACKRSHSMLLIHCKLCLNALICNLIILLNHIPCSDHLFTCHCNQGVSTARLILQGYPIPLKLCKLLTTRLCFLSKCLLVVFSPLGQVYFWSQISMLGSIQVANEICIWIISEHRNYEITSGQLWTQAQFLFWACAHCL